MLCQCQITLRHKIMCPDMAWCSLFRWKKQQCKTTDPRFKGHPTDFNFWKIFLSGHNIKDSIAWVFWDRFITHSKHLWGGHHIGRDTASFPFLHILFSVQRLEMFYCIGKSSGLTRPCALPFLSNFNCSSPCRKSDFNCFEPIRQWQNSKTKATGSLTSKSHRPPLTPSLSLPSVRATQGSQQQQQRED